MHFVPFQVYNGPHQQGQSLSRLCRMDQESHKLTSSGSLVSVVFHSSDVDGNTHRGFNASYETVVGGKKNAS